MAQLLAGGKRHQKWASQLRTAKEHLLSGNVDQFARDFSRFHASAPRFLPLQLRATIERIEILATSAASSPDFPVFSALLHYSRGNYEYFAVHDSTWPLCGQQIKVYLGPRRPQPNGTPESLTADDQPFTILESHIRAELDHNPAALQRIAVPLERISFWGPALSALRSSQQIFQQRRASGSSTAATGFINELEARIRESTLGT